MTEHAQGGHPPAEADSVQTWTVATVGLASLVIFAVSSVATVAWMRRAQAELNPSYPVIPAEAGKRKIGIPEQQLFENANRAQVLKEQQRRKLESYGWVDREKGLVHLPIDRAMDLTLRGERP